MINSVIVADSSPLISLAIIAQLELLPQLYQRILPKKELMPLALAMGM
ncbi:MAG: hypothetical protein ACYT04_70865 [Nostoc sp.]